MNVVDIEDFNERVVGAYNDGTAEKGLEADDQVARSIIPAGNRRASATSVISLPISRYSSPKTALAAWTASPNARTRQSSAKLSNPQRSRNGCRKHRRCRTAQTAWREQWAITNKYFNVLEKKNPGAGGKFGIFIDPTKCKGCAECVDACGDHNALKMIPKDDKNMEWYKAAFNFYREHAGNAQEVHQRKSPRRHDAGRTLAALRRRRRILHGLRRSHGAAHDACGDGFRLRQGKHRHGCGHRLQHGVHVDLSVQSVSDRMDQFPVSKTLLQWRWAYARSGTCKAGRTNVSGSSAATAR